jgi:amidase
VETGLITVHAGVPGLIEAFRQTGTAAVLCADLGHGVEEVDPKIDGAAAVPTFLTLASANTVVNLASHPTKGRSPRPGEVENVTYATGLLGEKVTAADYIRATQTAHRLGRQAAFHATYDVLLTPALPLKLGWIDMTMDDVHEYWRRVFHFSPFTVCFNLTGQPAIVLPLGRCDAMTERTATGFPIAVQLVARYGGEALLFRLAAQLEKARPWFDRKPLMVSDSNSESARSAAR